MNLIRSVFVVIACFGHALWVNAALGSDLSYVGSQHCSDCHQQQHQQWQGSHHDWAMKTPTPTTVLGDFKNAQFGYAGKVHRFSTTQEAGQTNYWITTDNANGELERFKVKYTFGFYPLQQYLVDVGNGNLQVPSISWDSRPAEEGGQRWFHLYPDENITHNDPLHWTGSYLNWNSRCADCHSTQLLKQYQPQSNSYQSIYSEINVTCEACHGPASGHLDWLMDKPALAAKGFSQSIKGLNVQQILAGEGKQLNHLQQGQIASCGVCHSRRGVLAENGTINFHDHFRLQLLDEGLYYPDGQILDEVYVLGSFLQSKMYQQGVTCSNCHDPHSLKLKAPDNQLCAQCHAPSTFDTPAHHRHATNTAGSFCVDCHMPATTYMGVDPRRDHSLRIPRPDLTAVTGAPNACTSCHQDKSSAWAASQLDGWLKESGKTLPSHFGEVFANPSAETLAAIVESELPGIVRASAIDRLARYSQPVVLDSLFKALEDDDPLVIASALRGLDALPLHLRHHKVMPLLTSETKAIRMAAVEVMLEPGLNQVMQTYSSKQQQQLQTVLEEYRQMMQLHRDSAVGRMNLASFYRAQDDVPQAITFLQSALELEPWNGTAAINLADIYRQQKMPQQSAEVLAKTLKLNTLDAGLHYAYGLALIRLGKHNDALAYLAKATQLQPKNGRFGYVYLVALNNLGQHVNAVIEADRLIAGQLADNNVIQVAIDSALKSNQPAKVAQFRAELSQQP